MRSIIRLLALITFSCFGLWVWLRVSARALSPTATVHPVDTSAVSQPVNSTPANTTPLTQFNQPAEATRWRAVNDGVMGGVSQGQFMLIDEQIGRFSGEISLENNGGFASIRRGASDVDFEGVSAIALHIKGDGRTYQFRLRATVDGRDIAYRAHFPTTVNRWTSVQLPLSDFEPVFRGQVLSWVPPVSPTNIEEVGFMLADKQPGSFQLEIERIELIR